MCSPSKNTVRKNVAVNTALEIGSDREITALRDTKDVGENASRVKFFPPNINQSGVRADYQHPLPYFHAITSIAVVATLGAVRSVDLATLNPYNVLNALRQSMLVITANNGDTVIVRLPLRQVMDLSGAYVEHRELGADADGADAYVLHLPSGGYYDLDQPFVLQAGDNYGAEIQFEDGSAFPAEAAYEGAPLGLEVDMKAAVPAPEGD